MYSGTTLTRFSGRMMGAHQKIDRIARKQLDELAQNSSMFPKIREILQFEGTNGPDGIKRKSPAQDEPWHYFNPFNDVDGKLIKIIASHYDHLSKELKQGNKERTAFEAAWLAHAVVDGLTPAHHFPYEEKLIELRGEGIETRTSIRQKIIMPGLTRSDRVLKNWKMWGPKGLLTTHGLFEIGIATLIAPLSFKESMPNEDDIKDVNTHGPIEHFQRTAKEIAVLNMYEAFYQKGWTPKLAWQVRHQLGPALVKSVSLFWLAALNESKANV